MHICAYYLWTNCGVKTNNRSLKRTPIQKHKIQKFSREGTLISKPVIWCIGVAHGPVGPAMAGPIISQTSALAKCITDIDPSLSSLSSWVRIHYWTGALFTLYCYFLCSRRHEAEVAFLKINKHAYRSADVHQATDFFFKFSSLWIVITSS